MEKILKPVILHYESKIYVWNQEDKNNIKPRVKHVGGPIILCNTFLGV